MIDDWWWLWLCLWLICWLFTIWCVYCLMLCVVLVAFVFELAADKKKGGGGYCVLTVLLYLLYFFIFLAYIYNIFAFGGYHFVNKLLVQKLRPVFRSFRWLNFLRYVTFRYIFSSFFSSRERKREIKFKLNKYNKTVQNNVHT
jgi:hypothetical protein